MDVISYFDLFMGISFGMVGGMSQLDFCILLVRVFVVIAMG